MWFYELADCGPSVLKQVLAQEWEKPWETLPHTRTVATPQQTSSFIKGLLLVILAFSLLLAWVLLTSPSEEPSLEQLLGAAAGRGEEE